MIEVVAVQDAAKAVTDSQWDAVVLVSPQPSQAAIATLAKAAGALASVDKRADSLLRLLHVSGICGERLVLAPTGSLSRDYDDVRRFADAAGKGMRRARDAGATRPLLIIDGIPSHGDFEQAVSVAGVGGLGALWEPLEARESLGASVCEPITKVGLAHSGGAVSAGQAAWVSAVEEGRRLARDLAGTEPERMAPPKFAAYCVDAFAGSSVKVTVNSDTDALLRDYPLLSGVARASLDVERHRPQVVRLEYVGKGPITRTLMLAGKGVTYDTGGADLKTGGHMAGMSRDKGGAAAVAGLMLCLARLNVPGIKVIAELGVVRNSIGSNAFVTDEILVSHGGVRVRIGNTDAEGRLVLADLLSHLRVESDSEIEPCLFTVATLTGHAGRAMGQYSIALDNRAAREANIAVSLAAAGETWGDPFELSRLRREDWEFIEPRTKADDVISSNGAPSTQTARGHQFPAAFLAIAAGLVPHCHRDAAKPIRFTHIDIGGSGVEDGDWQHGRPTAVPIIAMLTGLIDGGVPQA